MMRIGIVSYGNDSLELFGFLQRHDHDYVVYYNTTMWPLGDKGWDTSVSLVKEGIAYLQSQGVDTIIVPPLYELLLQEEYPIIMSLYRRYIDVCLEHSLVGKVLVVHEDAEVEIVQPLLQSIVDTYTLTPRQEQHAGFVTGFAWRTRGVGQWKYLLRHLSPRNFLMNNIVKTDLRLAKDADVDTILPTNYAHFACEKSIQRFVKVKRVKFHGLDVLESCFISAIDAQRGDESGSAIGGYAVSMHVVGTQLMLDSARRYMIMLSRGKNIEVEYKQIGG